MKARRSSAARRAPVAAPPAPTRERYRPPWMRQRVSDVQHAAIGVQSLIDDVVAGAVRLPRFQRPYVWSDAQIARLFDSIIGGYHVGSVLVWEQSCPAAAAVEIFNGVEVPCPAQPYHRLVVDGQQRIGAIVSAAFSGRFWFDVRAGALVTSDGPWCVPARYPLDRRDDSLVTWYEGHAAAHGVDPMELRDAAIAMYALMGSTAISAVRIPSDWPLVRVVESYRRLATEGTPMAADDLAAGLRRALGDGA